MKCPYNVIINQVEQTRFEYDDGEQTIAETVTQQEIVWPECLRAECAAWGSTGCQYRG